MKIIKNIKKNTILLSCITIIVLYFVLKDDFKGIIHSLEHINYIFIIIALFFYLTSIFLRAYANYIIVHNKEKYSIKEAIRQNLITQLFNGITPFSTGGQPMEIYMLTKCNIPLVEATNYTVQSFIFYQIALVLCGIIAVTYNFIFKLFPKVTLLQNLVLLGFIINIIVVIVLLLSYSKKAVDFLSKIIIKLTKLLKIKVKAKRITDKFSEYYNASQELKNNKALIFKGIIINILSLSFLYLVPLFVAYSLGIFDKLGIMETIVSSSYVYLIGAFVPIPGASGGIEYGFTQFFGNYLKNGKLSACLLIWRTITYYFGIIIGAIIFNINKKEDEKCE